MKVTKLFNLTALMILMMAVISAGCGKNDSILGPNNQVTFQVSQQAGVNGGTDFLFKPSVNVKISQIVSKLAAQQFADTLNFTNTNYVYSKDTTYIINEYTGVVNGQQWNFSFKGTLTGQANSGYNVTTNYTVQ